MQTSEQPKESNNPLARFEGFFIQMVMPGLEGRCGEIVTQFLGSDWQIKPIGDNYTEFEITLNDDALSAKQAWDKSYELRSQPGIIDAEPLFTVPIAENNNWDEELKPQSLDSENQANQISEDGENPDWSLKQLRVFETWQRFFPDPNKLPGHGIIIGHPDTGYTPHPEIVNNLLTAQGFDFLKNDNNPTDELQRSGGEVINNPGHGTSTASVIVSPQSAQANYPNGKYVTGVAPGAKIIPLRVTYSVVLLSIRNLAEAIEYAANNGIHILTISLGAAFPNQRLRTAIIYAQKRGVIIVSASGTSVPFVVYPAAYDEVIAVTGSTVERGIWIGATTGKQVDVVAPGASIWYAKTRKQENSDEFEYSIESGAGTSFSAPFVAGVAALWLSYHGRDNLIERYGAEKIPFIFNQLLRDTCDTFPTWKPNKHGAGIVNAEKLLDAPLPDNVNQSIIVPGMALQQYSPVDSGNIDTFSHLFESQLPTSESANSFLYRDDEKLNSSLGEILQVSEAELPQRLKEVGQELAFYLTTNPELYKQFAASLQNQEPSPELSSKSLLTQFKSKEAENLNSMRGMLLKQGISEVLKKKIENKLP
ncbi:S8 family peptidase [Brunnivagina elsteri]|uniref:Subtilisin-like serine protease n=1 Tax=Brunnivagina elsteri CCALA 953 TaxID=987040 RepID=A0A2A2TQ01_9CYAN|nr:S8 family serine peptidase [Calothrix elsteri]PAX60549.1 subtilisin-like serine protease [Calothrix elsteri CCALA 953]